MTDLSTDLSARWTPSAEQDQQAWEAMDGRDCAEPRPTMVVTAHLLINKEYGWWGPDVEVRPIDGLFSDRDEASTALAEEARKAHEETGLPVTGGWTYHRLPQRDEAPRTADGRYWKTSWSVFEDILAVYPKKERT